MAGSCARCHRALKDPKSVERGMGPVCWAKSNGDIFEKGLEADEQEWARREELLRKGGEIDFGCNWQYIDYNPDMALQIPVTMRVSVRFREGAYEAYGVAAYPGENKEIVFERSQDIKAVYKAAVQAGPHSNAQVAYIQRQRRRQSRQMKMKLGVK